MIPKPRRSELGYIPDPVAGSSSVASTRMGPGHAGVGTPRPGKFRPGFTLLELLIVLIILSIGAGLVVVRITTGTDRARFEGAVRQAAAFLRNARDQARTLSVSVQILADGDERRLEAVALEADEAGSLHRRPIASWTLPRVVKEFRIEAPGPPVGDGALSFSHLGTTRGGALFLLGASERGKRIRVLEPTGALEVSDYEGG